MGAWLGETPSAEAPCALLTADDPDTPTLQVEGLTAAAFQQRLGMWLSMFGQRVAWDDPSEAQENGEVYQAGNTND